MIRIRRTKRELADRKRAGAKVRAWRLENDWTLEKLSNRLNCSLSYVSNIERGLSRPSIEDAKVIVDLVPEVDVYEWYPELKGL